MFWTFLLLTEEDTASCSRAFRKPKSAEEERNLIENAIPKSTRAVKIFLEWQNGRKNKNPAIKPCAFKTDRSKVQRLDTDIANMTAEPLNFWLIKFVPLILWKSKFTVTCDWLVETTLIMHLPFVSIAYWELINIHKSRAVSLYLIKHRMFNSYSSRTRRIWADIYNQRGLRPSWLLSAHIRQVREE